MRSWKFSLLGWLLFTNSIPVIVYIISFFDIDYRVLEVVATEGIYTERLTPGAVLRLVALGITLGVACMTCVVGWCMGRGTLGRLCFGNQDTPVGGRVYRTADQGKECSPIPFKV